MKAGDSWLILGKRGSGKTWFAKDLTRTLQGLYGDELHTYILDTKMRDFNDWEGIIQTDGEAPPLIPKWSRNIGQQIWQPLIEDPEQIERWLFNLRKDAPALVLMDEVAVLEYKKGDTSPEYKKLLKLGRGLPISTISLTQELVAIPRSIITQTVHTCRFRLGKMTYDQNLANRLLNEEVNEPPDKFGFYYSHESNEEPLYYVDKDDFLFM